MAGGFVPFAQGSDGGGSIRIPAACCGLFGMKPSRGRVSFSPAGEGWAGASIQHAVTRSVRDSAALLGGGAHAPRLLQQLVGLVAEDGLQRRGPLLGRQVTQSFAELARELGHADEVALCVEGVNVVLIHRRRGLVPFIHGEFRPEPAADVLAVDRHVGFIDPQRTGELSRRTGNILPKLRISER